MGWGKKLEASKLISKCGQLHKVIRKCTCYILFFWMLYQETYVKANVFNMIALMKSVSRGDNWTGSGQGRGLQEQ